MLVLWQLDRVWETGILPTVFLQGLRVDLILAGMAVAPLLLVLPVLGHRYSWFCLEEAHRVLGGSGDYAGCVYGTCHTDVYQPVRCTTQPSVYRIFEIPTGSFFDAVDRVQAHGVSESGVYRGRHCVVLASTTALASRTCTLKPQKGAPGVAPGGSDRVYVRGAQPQAIVRRIRPCLP